MERRYRERSLVHELDFHTDAGVVRVIDFMPPRGTDPDIVRIVEGIEGNVPMLMELVLRFDYGSIVPWVRHVDDNTRIAVAGPDAVCLQTPVEVRGENMRTVGEFTVSAGDRAPVRAHVVPLAPRGSAGRRSRVRARQTRSPSGTSGSAGAATAGAGARRSCAR